MPSVWIFNHYAGLPEAVPATRTFELSRSLVERGWDVTAIACSFNHYKFVDDLPADSERFVEKTVDGVRWVFIANTTPYSGNGTARLRGMLDYARHASKWSRKQPKGPDVVIGTTVHPFAAEAAARIAKRTGAKFCYEITDLWPESLVDLGSTKPGSAVFRTFAALEKRAFRAADGVIGLLPGIPVYARETYGLELKRFAYVPNGMIIRPLDEGAAPTPKTGTVAYAGGFARYHAMGNIISAAEILEAEQPGAFQFNLYGNGPERQPMEELVAARGISNVTFHGYVKKVDLRARLQESELCVSTTVVMPILRFGVSHNKIFDYFDAARPVVYAAQPAGSGDTGGNNPIIDADAGISVGADDPVALAAAIIKLSAEGPDAHERYGANGRAFLEREHSFSQLGIRLDEFLRMVVKS